MQLKNPVYLALLMLAMASRAIADNYEIEFVEGAYQFDSTKKADYLSNKYLARVTIKQGGRQVAEVRGSTISDSIFLYGNWFEQGNTTSPADADIARVESELRSKPDNSIPGSFEHFGNIADTVIASVPVVASGTYKFTMGLHKQWDCYDMSQTPPVPRMSDGHRLCPHGFPYVPRLLGTSYPNEPAYDPASNRPQDAWMEGGFVRSITRDNKHNFANVAAGINIHDGRRTLDIRDSEGCLTIHPDQWKAFYEALPDPEAWRKGGHSGTVKVTRISKSLVPIKSPSPPPDVSTIR